MKDQSCEEINTEATEAFFQEEFQWPPLQHSKVSTSISVSCCPDSSTIQEYVVVFMLHK